MKSMQCMLAAAGACALALAQPALAQEMETEVETEPGETEAEVEIQPGETEAEIEMEPGETEADVDVEPDVQVQVQPMPPPAPVVVTPAPAPVIVEEDDGEPDLVTPFGVALSLGGGVRGFTEEDARDVIDEGGAWDARVLFGSRSIIALEAAYVGSASDVVALGLDPDATLMQNGVEGALRLNILTGMWQPYVLAGAGWSRYTVTNEDFNTSSVESEDDVAQFPLGAGVAFRYEGLVLDARGVYRPTASAELVPDDDGNMPSWAADLTAGIEF